jgi:hypothetical protein
MKFRLLYSSKFLILLSLSIFSIQSYSQEIIWTTDQSIMKAESTVTIKKAIHKVLEYYDIYDYYYDNTGYSKEEYFKKNFENDSLKLSYSSIINLYNKIDKIFILAIRIPSSIGSVVSVICVDKHSVHTIDFTNRLMLGFNMTNSTDRNKFEKWFRAIVDPK